MGQMHADDMDLVREFAANGSEAAFATLVRRHVNLVYSAALRRLGNATEAEEVAQIVFLILAKKAGGLRNRTILSGWLYQTAQLTAANHQRAAVRRQHREQEAFMQFSERSEPDASWQRLSPLLEEAMARLSQKERDAIVLRFFENRTVREVAAAQGLREDAAQKRVNRATDKLRDYFVRRGIQVSAAALLASIGTHAVQAAPVELASRIVGGAAVKGTLGSASTLTLKTTLKIMAWTKAKTAVGIGAAIILATGTAVTITEHTAHSGTDVERRPVVLQTQWQIGKKYLVHKEDVQAMEMEDPGQGEPVKQVTKQTENFYLFPVSKLNNDGWELRLEFESLALTVTNGNYQVFAADSNQNPAQDARNPVGARLRKMTGARLEYFTDANGKVVKMDGYPELVARVAGKNQKEQAAFKDLFSEIALEKFGSVGEDTVPRRVVKLGDHWAMNLKVPSNAGNLQVDLKCHFKNWEPRANHRCIHITFTGAISPAAGSDASALRVQIEKGTVTGDIWFDPELGMAVDSSENVKAQLKINQYGQTWNAPLHQKTRVTMIAVENA